MKKIYAYKCSKTGQIFEQPGYALRSEFEVLMREAFNGLPTPPGECPQSKDQRFCQWLTENLACGVYQSALPGLIQALLFLRDNRKSIEKPYSDANG